jgi:4-amino-4-deoxy-L-arabinose transferase-like glycosyltransferase
MMVFGTSADVARWLVLLSFIVSCWCVYRMARRILDDDRASAVMILYSIAPLIFDYSRDVMLEMPALALVMVSVDQFDLWLRGTRRRHLYIAAIRQPWRH